MTDIIIRPSGSNSRPVLEDAYRKARPGDAIIYSDGVYNIEGLTTKDAAIRIPGQVTSKAMNRYGATTRRGDNQISLGVLMPSAGDRPDSFDQGQLWDGFVWDMNIQGQGGFHEDRRFFDAVGLRDSKFQWIKGINPCSDMFMVGKTFGGSVRTAQPWGLVWANVSCVGDRSNRAAISFISCGKLGIRTAVEGSCDFEGMSRPDMTAAINLEPDTSDDVIEAVGISGTFKKNTRDVTSMALAKGCMINLCVANIRTDAYGGDESIISRCAVGAYSDFRVTPQPWQP